LVVFLRWLPLSLAAVTPLISVSIRAFRFMAKEWKMC
jgi:hypothetical protein